MSYIEESLSDGEEIKDVFKLHWFTKIPMFAYLVLALVFLSFTLSSIPFSLSLILFGICLILALWEHLKLISIEQGITNKRVILKTGIISRKSEEMKITSIETVEIDQGILGRIFGFGAVSVTGRGISDLIYKNINNPMDAKKAIESVDAE